MKRPRFADNEFLDTDAGCWALANYCGCEIEATPTHQRRRPTMTREQAYELAERRLRGG